MHTIHNARVQLLATALNNLALAFMVAGFVAPAAGGQLHGWWQTLTALAWIGTGAVIHSAAHFALGGLRQ